jgi:DNA-binding protein Fis
MRPLLDTYGNRKDQGESSQHNSGIGQIKPLRCESLSSECAGYAILDTQLRYLQLNEAFAAISGLGADDHIGRTVYEISPKIATYAESAVKQILSTGDPVHFLEITDPEGDGIGLKRYISSFIPIWDEHGLPSKVGLLMIDSSTSVQMARPAPAQPHSLSDEIRGLLGKEPDEDADVLTGLSKALAKAAEVLKKQRMESHVKRLDFSQGIDFYQEVSRFEIDLLTQALKHTGGNRTKAAELLGIKVSTIHAMVKRYGIGPISESE